MVAILIVGGLTFVVTGVAPVTRVADSQSRVGTAMAAVGIAAVLVLAGLLLNGAEATRNAFEQSRVDSTIDGWLSTAPAHSAVQTAIDGDRVMTVIVGPSNGLPAVETLAEGLSDALDRSITVDVRLIVEERLTATGT